MQYGDEKRDKLNRLEKKLYSRNAPNIIKTENRSDDNFKTGLDFNDLSGEENLKEDWQDTKIGKFDELTSKFSNMAGKRSNLVNKFFIFSVFFFLVAFGVAFFMFFGGTNSVSSKNVDIKVVGPTAIGGGQETSFDINVINNNNINLNGASLLVKYPEGTRMANDLTKELDQERFNLDDIKSGQSYNQNIKAVFFGEKESKKEIKISLEYRVENSSALFYKEKNYEFSISSAPIIISPTYQKEINSGQEISFDLELASNSKDKINNFLVSLEYPFGFIFKDSSPKSSFGNNVWQFSDLNSGEKRKISVRGTIVGQDNEEKVFRIKAGTPSADDDRAIAVVFSETVESVLIKKSFIGLEVFVGGSDGNFAGQGGSQVATEIIINNNLPTKLFNISVEASFKGGAFDAESVLPGYGGFFQSFNNTILWDKRSVADLAEMEPGSVKNLSFRLSPLLYANVPKGAKPEIEITIKVRGERVSDLGSAEDIFSTENRKIILATNVGLLAKTTRSVGNIENSGPVPPKVDNPTTYTIVWSLTNSFNQISGAEVRATLPSYVKWTGIKSPESEPISYNEATKEVIWNAGSVLPNTGFGSTPKQVYFQVEFLPSISQLGQTPILLGETTFSGTDKITGQKISAKTNAVSINFSGDPSFKIGSDKVIQ